LALHKQKTPPHDVIVLNSLSLLDSSINFIKKKGYKEIHTYLDNDKAGEKAMQKLDESFNIPIKDHRTSYTKFNDLNDYFLAKNKKKRELDMVKI